MLPSAFSSKAEIQALDEYGLRTQVIMPFLGQLGYQGIFHSHGPEELGKDIVAWAPGDFGKARNLVVVAKVGKISGARAIREPIRQLRQALNSDFRGGTDNTLRRAQAVWLVTNGDIPLTARNQILSEFNEEEKSRIQFIDGQALWEEWTKHFDVTVRQTLESLQHIATRYSDEAISTKLWVDPTTQGLEVRVNDPDKLTDHHTRISGAFRFPDTAEGKAKYEEYKRFEQEGGTLVLTSDFMQLEHPKAVQDLIAEIIGDTSGPMTYTLTSVPDPASKPVRIETEM